MKKQQLFDAFGEIDERYLEEARQFRPGSVKRRFPRALRIAAAAAVLTLLLCATVTAANIAWGQQIRQWLGIGNTEVAGYEENPGVTSRSELGKVSVLSSFISGNRLVAYCSVTPVENGPDLNLEAPWDASLALLDPEDPMSTAATSNIVSSDIVVKSQSPEEIILELTLIGEQLTPGKAITIQLVQSDPAQEGQVLRYPAIAFPLTESTSLHAAPNLDVHNDLADSDGVISDIAVSAGNIELTLNCEYTEIWCDRVCVPDRGKTFMEKYTGESWTPGTPESIGKTTPHFSDEDERAIFDAYSESWDRTASEILSTVKLHMKDGTVLTLGDTQEQNYSFTASLESHDAEVYRWVLNPVLDTSQVSKIEILGNTYPLT